MNIALIQMNSQPDRSANLAQALRLMRDACAGAKPDLLVLPEHFDWTGGTPEEKRQAADLAPGGEAYEMVRTFAREAGVAIHAGSLLERRSDASTIFNTSVVFDASGTEIGRYRKIHLFDITAPDGKVYAESAVVAAGDGLLVYAIGGFRVGCAICYDLRFSRLFDQLAGLDVDLIILPAAFTQQTGKDHWEVLCRARAIEFQCYFVACGQCGSYRAPNGEERVMFGHSTVVDPWGRVIATADREIGVINAVLDRTVVDRVREMIPMAEHRRDLRSMSVVSTSMDRS
ncbi:Nitrilase/cyanide hydratase and apolipoprotein N-acyltransferase [Agrobacterium albertimagni AOL15]|uniref:Nitrilase/cyanide hydratase and apolipoprotein N-acyltransferase n=1 Tax=Agrobacterium albertimagni AOL15 TaxID=1156935 RepID=K2Q8S3_9HYPH|nr:carbon-nitrogen hydrolase family protein [Agrobacterium albertimagni]EKF61610.1 Nitrilase/cyanide hydratase and apolipoprotein N-acyltransferase [Agrobacterium albertimagni AOL15]